MPQVRFHRPRQFLLLALLVIVLLSVSLRALLSDFGGSRSDPALASTLGSPQARAGDPKDNRTSTRGLFPPLRVDRPDASTSSPPSGPRIGNLSEHALSLRQTRGRAEIVTRVRTDDPVVFLTIDDGSWTPPGVRRWFANTGVPATAFLTDVEVGGSYGYFRRLSDEGVVVENHAVHHQFLRGASYAHQARELCGASERFQREFGQVPKLFRPPFGAYDDTTRVAAQACGMPWLILWSATITDGKISYQGFHRLRKGDIVLMHFTSNALRDLEAFRSAAKASHLQPADLSAYLSQTFSPNPHIH